MGMSHFSESPRHPDWTPIEHRIDTIRKGERYRLEWPDGRVAEDIADHDWAASRFDPDVAYFVLPRPAKEPRDAIPEGVDNATLMSVTTTLSATATILKAWREGDMFYYADLVGHEGHPVQVVTSAEPVTAVPTAALERLHKSVADGQTSDAIADAAGDLLTHVANFEVLYS